jgi:tetratricopeptide (TPR) repeat protein
MLRSSVRVIFLTRVGLANKKLGRNEEALDAFYKLQAILRNHPQVLTQIASLYERLGDIDQALEWFVTDFAPSYLFIVSWSHGQSAT